MCGESKPSEGRAATLHHLPAPPTQIILENLDLASLKNLRLTCRALSDNCIGPRFQSFFPVIKTDLSENSLRSLDKLVSNPLLRPVVKSITVLAMVYNFHNLEYILRTKKRPAEADPEDPSHLTFVPCTTGDLAAVRDDLNWMNARQQEDDSRDVTAVVDQLASILKKLGELEMLELDGSFVEHRHKASPLVYEHQAEWVQNWISASRAFSIATLAMAQSKVTVDALKVFEVTGRCSVQAADITNAMENIGSDNFALVGKHIKNFAISTSTRVCIKPAETTDSSGYDSDASEIELPERPRYDYTILHHDDPELVTEANFPGVATMLSQMPNLEVLRLHLFRTVHGRTVEYDQLFAKIARDVRLPALEQLSLEGLFATQEDLLLFLSNHPNIKMLTLRTIDLTSGAWEPIFAHISSMPALERVRLSTLCIGDEVLNLDPKEERFSKSIIYRFESYPHGDGPLVFARRISAEELRAGLDFKPRPYGMMLGSPRGYRFVNTQTIEFGPPLYVRAGILV